MGQVEVERVLRSMLRDLFEADSRGARREKLARAHGYTDGYMRALIDLGVTTQRDLLDLVLDERRRVATEESSSAPQIVLQPAMEQREAASAV